MTTTAQPTVLVIEDSDQLRRAASATLRHQGYRVLEAGSGEEALSMARLHPVDLILLDLGLPDTRGAEVLRRLRQMRSTAHAPCVVWSASDAGASASPGPESLVAAHLVKSMTPLSLLADLVGLTMRPHPSRCESWPRG